MTTSLVRPSKSCLGRVGGFAVALGVGAAIVTGWTSGLAWADETGGTAGSTGSNTTSGTKETKADPDEAQETTKPGGDLTQDAPASTTKTPPSETATAPRTTADDRPSNKPGTSKGSDPATPKPPKRKTPAPVSTIADVKHDPKVPATATRATTTVADPQEPTVEGESLPNVTTQTLSRATQSTELTTQPPPKPKSPTVTAVTSLVSGVVEAILNPLAASDTPGTPAATPPVWSLMAFARREFETAFSAPSLAEAPVDAQTTSQPLTQAVQNSLTYTGPPNIIDQLTLLGLRLMRTVGSITGIDFTGTIGRLESTGVPPFFLTFGLHTRQTEFEASPGNIWKVWEFTPANPTGKAVIALHGGGFIFQPSILNWIDYTNMARNNGATVIVPLYPLATTDAGSMLNVSPGMADFISNQIDLHGAQNVSIYADSAGSVHAMGAMRELILRGDPVPAGMVLISLSADQSLTNPEIKTIDDPFFDLDNLGFWTTNSHTFDGIPDLKDPRISSLYMESDVLKALPPTTIYVGSEEILLPDNLLLYQRATDIGAPISMVVGTGLVHDWPVPGFLINSKAAVVRPDIYRQLGLIP